MRRHENDVDPLDDKNLKRLNQRVIRHSTRLYRVLERQVDTFFMKLDKETRDQLSKSQIVRSREKAYLWHRSNNRHININVVVDEDYLRKDEDPFSFISKKKNQPTRSSFNSKKFANILTGKEFEQEREKNAPNRANQVNIDEQRIISMDSWLSRRNGLIRSLAELRLAIKKDPKSREHELDKICSLGFFKRSYIESLLASNEEVS